MNTITARFGGGNAREVANKLMQDLDGQGVTALSVTLRESGNEMNPQIYEVPLPDRDRSKDNLGILPGQVLNSPLEGPGPVSLESQASLIPTQVPEMSKEQKAASAANEKASAAASADEVKVADEKAAEAERVAAEQKAAWEEENRKAAARGVRPMAPTSDPDAPDLKVAVVENPGTPANDNGVSGGVAGAVSTVTKGVRKAAYRVKKAAGK